MKSENLNLATTDKDEVLAVIRLAPIELAKLFLGAPYKADLYGCNAVRQCLYKKAKDTAGAAVLALDGHISTERKAVLLIVAASGYRRQVPPMFATANDCLQEALPCIKLVRQSRDTAWADRLQGAVEYEKSQILRPLGRFREAAELNMKAAEQHSKAGRTLDALKEQRMAAWNLLEATFVEQMSQGNISGEEIDRAAEELRKVLTMLELHAGPYDLHTRILVQLDQVRVSWWLKEEKDYREVLNHVKTLIDKDERLLQAFDWGYHVCLAASAMLLPDSEVAAKEAGLAAGKKIADDETMGADWRPEAMLATAGLLWLFKRDNGMGLRYLEEIQRFPDYQGFAKSVASLLLEEFE